MRVQDEYLEIGAYGCLLLCYLKEIGIEQIDIKDFEELKRLNIIGDDCFINDGNALLRYYKSNKRIHRGFNKDGNTIVAFRHNYNGHFVVLNKDRDIIFNSLEKSVCVNKGSLDEESARYVQ